jgi:hypothetical protein
MRTTGSFIILLVLSFIAACSKSDSPPIKPPEPTTPDKFLKYTIGKGQQFSDKNVIATVEYEELKFLVKFDSSAIYQTIAPVNQADINKLYGFSDNNAQHQDFSARFGWCWNKDSLRLYAYIYNNGVRFSRQMGVINIGKEYYCSIKVSDSTYIFKLDDTTQMMKRASTTPKGKGYKLYPYFGGNETAPHDIHIWIDEQ